jgi:heme oxygenase
LQIATHDVHERLHAHPGFAAVLNGTIDRDDYARLLCRLYGFYQPFEIAAQVDPVRTAWLDLDLAAFGISESQRSELPRCSELPDFAKPDAVLGALYVVEGAALGGVALARGLDALLGAGNREGRRFFRGHEAQTGALWRDYLLRLSMASDEPADRATIFLTANATFALFEGWLNGWNDP